MSKNDITGDSIISKANSESFRNQYDLIFRKKNELCSTAESISAEESKLTKSNNLEHLKKIQRESSLSLKNKTRALYKNTLNTLGGRASTVEIAKCLKYNTETVANKMRQYEAEGWIKLDGKVKTNGGADCFVWKLIESKL